MEIEIKEALRGVVEKVGGFGQKIEDLTSGQKALETRLTGFGDQLTAFQQKGVKGMGFQERAKSFGAEVVQAEGFKSVQSGQARHARIEIKNTILGEAGSPPQPTDTLAPYSAMRGIAGGAFRPLTFLDLVPRGGAESNQVHYTREASFTNAAAETAEGASKPQSTLTFEDILAPVRTVAHYVKASKQVLDDSAAFRSYLEGRMAYGVRQRLEAQLIAGNGTGSNIAGLAATGNHTDLTLVTADHDFDAANRAKEQVLTADYVPDAFLLHPADWGRMERKRTGLSGDEGYLGGQPGSSSYLMDGLQPRLWSLPVIVSTAVTPGTFFCLAMSSIMLWDRQEAIVEIFTQNEDDAIKNLMLIRAEGRWAFGVFQPAAVVMGSWPEAA